MAVIFKTIISMIVAMTMQASVITATEESPVQAADEFMHGMMTLQEETTDRYAGNNYVNFVVNLEGDEETVERMQEALFRNFSYEIRGTEQRDDLAVAKIVIRQSDFSGVMDKYRDKSYRYVIDHLYDEDITDKKKLNAKCLDIYVSQIEKVAKAGKAKKHTIYLIMESNGYHGWNPVPNTEVMEAMLGKLAIPDIPEMKESKEKK